MNRRDFIKTSIGAGVAASAGLLPARAFAAKGTAKKHPNILWIMMDDCRADAVGCYGRGWVRTPHMDHVAARGVRFDAAIVQNPVCVPSRKSAKSAHYAHTLGTMAMGKPADAKPHYLERARPDLPNLLNRCKEVGTRLINVGKTHAYTRDWDSQRDIAPHFDVLGRPRTDLARTRVQETSSSYPDVVTKTHKWAIGGTIPLKPEETSTWKLGNLAMETLKGLAAKDEPFSLRVSFHAPHVPCRVPKSYLIDPDKITLPLPSEKELASKPRFEREQLRVYAGGLDLTGEQIALARGTYYGMVSLVDVQVGRLVEYLKKAGILDNTVIAINSDQGFQLGEHGLWKKRVFYEQNVLIPFVLSCPSLLPAGKVIDEPVEMLDFVPTLMQLSGLDAPDSIQGRSLLPLMRGDVTRWREACFSEIDHSMSMYQELREGTGRRVMVRTKEWKLVYFMDERVADKDGALYNLKKDPGEIENLYGRAEHADVVSYLEGLCEKWDQAT